MELPLLVRYKLPAEENPRAGLQLGQTIHDVTTAVSSPAAWLRASAGRVPEAIADLLSAAQQARISYAVAELGRRDGEGRPYLLPPIDKQPVWAAGVTYSRSRTARQEEAVDGGDIYARVYTAERPELFFKAAPGAVVGPWGNVGIRRDARWNVPEPELGLVFNPALEIAGLVVGNDMSSRDIEGENPLYLPQAKMYTASCALGPGLALLPVTKGWPPCTISLQIKRGDAVVFAGQTHTDEIRRTPLELGEFLGRSQLFPDGVVLLTGTGIVPADEFTLRIGDEIAIAIEGVGQLTNYVIQV